MDMLKKRPMQFVPGLAKVSNLRIDFAVLIAGSIVAVVLALI